MTYRNRRAARTREWKPGPDYRIVCDCQRHARRQRSFWRRTLRFASRATAVLVAPLALAFFDIPSKAMNLNVSSFRVIPGGKSVETATNPKNTAESALRIFTTASAREQFLPTTATLQRALTVDDVRQDFFKSNVPYGAIIYREAKKNNLPPELVAAMVQTESDFRPRLVSHKSAQGLMQIVPSTARILGIANPFDPEQNIAAGTRYYRRLLNRFGDERLALAAYNAGEGNVERFGGIPPFPETQSYIDKVNSRTHRYRQRIRSTFIASTRIRTETIH